MNYSLRPFRKEDAADLARCANYEEIADNLRNAFPQPYLFEDAADFIQRALEEKDGMIARAICSDDTVVGVVSVTKGSDVYEKTAELGYFLSPPYWGNGMTGKAIRDLTKEVFAAQEINRIYAEPFAPNLASRRVLEKAGFVCEGTLKNGAFKNGKTMDTCIYALTRD